MINNNMTHKCVKLAKTSNSKANNGVDNETNVISAGQRDRNYDPIKGIDASLWTIANESIKVDSENTDEVIEQLNHIGDELEELNKSITRFSELYAKVNADHIEQSNFISRIKGD